MLYGAHLSNSKFKIIKYFSSRCFPTPGLSGLKWRLKLFQIKRDKIKGLGCCHQYLPSVDILTLITIFYLQHEEGLSHVSNGTNPTQIINRNNKGKQHTKNPKPIFPSERALKPSKLCVHSCPLHYATNAGYLTTWQSSFLALPLCIFIIPLDSYFYSLLHSHLWHYKYLSSLFCCGGLAFMPSATHLAWSNQPPEFQKQT